MKYSRKMQRLHEIQVNRSMMVETGRLTIGGAKSQPNGSAKAEPQDKQPGK